MRWFFIMYQAVRKALQVDRQTRSTTLKNLCEKIQDEHKTTSDKTSPVNGIGRIVANPLQIILLKQCKTKG